MAASPERIPWEEASDLGLAHLELRQDPLVDRLSPAERERLALQALQAGEAAADGLLARFPGLPPSQIGRGLGVNVLLDSREPAKAFEARADYHLSPDGMAMITLNQPLIAETARRVSPYLPSPIDEEQVRETAVAHELFHHLEETSLGLLSHQMEQATFWRLGAWRVKRPIRRLREIGAHGFARRLRRYRYLPNLWDYLLLVERGQIDPERLWGMLRP